MRADLHIHSNCSDGSNNPFELIEVVKNAGIDVFALTDHDTVEGVKALANQFDFIHGVELTCICPSCGGNGKGIKCHILGYGVDIENPKLNALIEKGKVLRKNKLETRIKYLKDVHNIELTQEELDWLYTRKSVVKTHLANILVNRGLAEDNVSAMKKYLDGCKSGDTRFEGKEAIEAIVSAGGIPVWAHPLGGEGERHLSAEEFLPKLKLMLKFGIKGLECYYSRYNFEEINFLVKCAEENGLLISGGSDYHGTNKDIPAGKLNTENKSVLAEKLTILKNLR